MQASYSLEPPSVNIFVVPSGKFIIKLFFEIFAIAAVILFVAITLFKFNITSPSAFTKIECLYSHSYS